MTRGEHLMLYATLLASLLTLMEIVLLVAIVQPHRCHYLVPVIGKPGIYVCSEHPRSVKP